MSLKILFFLEYFPPHIGGVQTMMGKITQGLVQREHEVTVLTSQIAGTPTHENWKGVTVFRMKIPKPLRLFFNLLPIKKLYSLAKNHDIIHTSAYNGTWLAARIGQWVHRPVVCTVHEVYHHLPAINPYFSRLSAFFHCFLERRVLNSPITAFTADSWYTYQTLRLAGIEDDKITLLYPPVEIPELPPLDPEKRRSLRQSLGWEDFTFLYFGRPSLWRGVELLIQAFHKVSSSIPATLALILTPEPQKGYRRCLTLARQGPGYSRIHFLPPLSQEKLWDTLRCADCIVIPSFHEGFGLAAAEACHLRVPVVVSHICSLPEVVGGKVIFFKGGSRESLEKALLQAYTGEWQEKPLPSFPLKDTLDTLEFLYNRLLP